MVLVYGKRYFKVKLIIIAWVLNGILVLISSRHLVDDQVRGILGHLLDDWIELVDLVLPIQNDLEGVTLLMLIGNGRKERSLILPSFIALFCLFLSVYHQNSERETKD